MEQHAPPDADLVAQTLSGNREAFGQLYDRHAQIVRGVVLAVSSDWRGMEDMVQESFLRGYRSLNRLRDRGAFKAWITGIARQVARERRRALRRDRHEFRGPPWEVESSAGAESAVNDRDEIELVMRKVAELAEEERLAIHHFFFVEQNAQASAELLGLSRSGFYGLVQRALARLARILPADEPATRKGGDR